MNKLNSWCEIKENAVNENIKTFRGLIGKKVKLAPVIKSNAYGHGINILADIVIKNNETDFIAVNSLFEGMQVRRKTEKIPVLVMGETPNAKFRSGQNKNLTFVISSFDRIKYIVRQNILCDIHVKVNTGLNRLGCDTEECKEIIKYAKKHNVNITGMMSHFANVEDVTNFEYARYQIKNFKNFSDIFDSLYNKKVIKHISASASTLILPQAYFDMVRIGIGLYGLWPSEKTRESCNNILKKNIQLKPALSWKTRVVHIYKIKKNDYVGYGCSYRAKKDTTLAVIPVGYYEGYSRLLSNNAKVIINDNYCNVIGRICMNMSTIDVGKIKNIKINDEVIIIGNKYNKEITADTLAKKGNTINYEITTKINENIFRQKK